MYTNINSHISHKEKSKTQQLNTYGYKNSGENSAGKHDTIREKNVQVPTKNALANRRVGKHHTTYKL